MRTTRRTQPIGNIVFQSDSVTATAATTATAAACISSLLKGHEKTKSAHYRQQLQEEQFENKATEQIMTIIKILYFSTTTKH